MPSSALRRLLLASVFTLPALPAFAVGDFSTPPNLTTSQTVSGTATGTVAAGSSLTASSGTTITWNDSTASTTLVLTNDGAISNTNADGRAFNASGGNNIRNLTLNNDAGATITSKDDAVRININPTGGTIIVNNAGTISTTGTTATGAGQGIDFDAAGSGAASIQINNKATGLIQAQDQDGVRTGQGTILDNAGTIKAVLDAPSSYGSFDGVDMQANTATVINESTGVILGVRHGITSNTGLNVTNMAGGAITGANGSGVGSDGTGTVLNYGVITGAADANSAVAPYSITFGAQTGGDGDGVDIDLIGSVENYGTIQGTGAYGVDKSGFANGSEGLALGGGTVINHAGALISGANNGILVDDGAGGSGVVATAITNAGTIRGLNGFGVSLVGAFNDSVNNSGMISAVNGPALSTGDGADTVTNSGLITASGGKAVDLGAGNDTLNLLGGSSFTGVVDGGAGTDVVNLQTGVGSFAGGVNFETMNVQAGSWTLTGAQSYGAVTVASGATATVANTVTTGTATFAPGSTYGVKVDNTGASGLVAATGAASLDGAVLVQPATGVTYGHITNYTILTAAGGVSGTFTGATSTSAFLVPQLTYSANQVMLTLRRNDVQFGDVAVSTNQRTTGAAVSGAGFSNPLYQALLPLSDSQARDAEDQLSGDLHPSVTGALLERGQDSAGVMLGRMAGPQSGAWVKGFTLTSTQSAYDGRAKVEDDRSGGLIGVDHAMDGWKLGVAGSLTSGSVKLPSRAGKADIDGHSFDAYAGGAFSGLNWNLGGEIASYDIDTARQLATAGLSQRLTASYSADGDQAFGEVSLGSGGLQPFAAVNWSRIKVDAFTETGGSAAIGAAEQEDDVTYSTLGARYDGAFAMGAESSLTTHLTAAWRHTFGRPSQTVLAFTGGGPGFAVDGGQRDADVGLLDLGGDLKLGAGATLSLDAKAQLSPHTTQYGADLGFNWRF